MNGRIIVLGSDTKYHPLRTWRSEFQGRNGAPAFKTLFCFQSCPLVSPLSPDNLHRDSFVGFAAREGAIGIYAADATRNRGDISGESLPFQFTIEDNTKGQGDPRHAALRDGMPYKVPFALHICTLFRRGVGSFLKSVDR